MSGRGTGQPGSWLSVLAVALFFLAWEGVSRLGWVSPVLLSSPTRIAAAGYRLLGTGVLQADLAFTLKVFGLSVVVATFAGTGLGLAIGYSPTVYRLLHPFIVAVNSLPKIVLMPLIVLWLGIGMSANVFLGALMASFPVIISTYTGVLSLERDFVLVARAFGASRPTLLRTIVLPGVTPYLLSGLRVGVNYAMVGVLISEFFASSRGVGYRMVMYMSNFEVEQFFVCLVLVAGFTLLVTGLLHALESRVHGWRPSAFETSLGL